MTDIGQVKDQLPSRKRGSGVTTPELARLRDRYINADEYLELALSSRKLWRADQSGGNIKGLLDPHTGDRLLVKDQDLVELGSQQPEDE